MLDREIFYTLLDVMVLSEQHRHTYKRTRPHSSLRPPDLRRRRSSCLPIPLLSRSD